MTILLSVKVDVPEETERYFAVNVCDPVAVAVNTVERLVVISLVDDDVHRLVSAAASVEAPDTAKLIAAAAPPPAECDICAECSTITFCPATSDLVTDGPDVVRSV
jgi:hypothetical protein